MKKLLLGLSLLSTTFLNAQTVRTLSKTITLEMPKKAYMNSMGADSMPGTRGGAVAWHPILRKYYAAFAGNGSYPLSVFDVSGKRLSEDDQTCLKDLRGLWYNSKLKQVCGNGYGDIGWFSYNLDNKGNPVEAVVFAPGANQPGQQSIGVYSASANKVYFLFAQYVYVYDENGVQQVDSIIRLYPGIARADDINKDDDGSTGKENYSSNVLMYTGIRNAEFGLLNVADRQVELYDRRTGLMTQKLKLPDDIKLWYAFNFSYANGTYWSFDQDTRTWTGYK